MAQTGAKLTPMMRQYFEIKEKYPDKDTILFFRLGDFYEMFFEDAEVASGILDIALTCRNKNNENPVPLCGIPYHAADGYIRKLLEGGKKIAICEQVEDPAQAKGIVKREVIKVITPGVLTEPDNLEASKNNFLASINETESAWGFAVVDVLTGNFKVTEFPNFKELKDELYKLEPVEVLISRTLSEKDIFTNNERFLRNITLTILDDPKFDPLKTESLHIKNSSLMPASSACAAGAICNYIEYTSKEILKHLHSIEIYKTHNYMIIDESTSRNLELTKTMIDNSRFGSLLWLMDKTLTSMGSRELRIWMLHPLTDVDKINLRLDSIGAILGNYTFYEELAQSLKDVSDLERTAGRIAIGNANARDLRALSSSLKVIPYLAELKNKYRLPHLLNDIFDGLDPLEDVRNQIDSAIVSEPPLNLREGGLINEGISPELDELRAISGKCKGFIANLEVQERKKTGITSLKVRFNKVFGYYIEITNTHKDRVPENYIRKQTLANAERFITEELKNFEEKVLGAEERIKSLEYEIFVSLKTSLFAHVERIKKTSKLIAILDAILALATVARENRYARPNVNDSPEIEIKEGRHPIIEKINSSDTFVPNDLFLSNTSERLIIITGPNMAGKSTVMRQVALIVLMAQMGSFVPAASAKIGIVDRIFTRVGASDNIMKGQSTFMVEMQEAATILNEATNKSLIIIDEIGRGTSTFDGVAIAWSVAEFIHDKIKAKSLFATHYHELTDLEKTKKNVRNFNIAVKEWNNKVIFLHKLVPGGVNHSYGIQVAELAGLPAQVIDRAKEVLANLEMCEFDEVGQPKLSYSKAKRKHSNEINQLQLFHHKGSDKDSKIIEEIKSINPDQLNPIEALNKLYEIKKEITDSSK